MSPITVSVNAKYRRPAASKKERMPMKGRIRGLDGDDIALDLVLVKREMLIAA